MSDIHEHKWTVTDEAIKLLAWSQCTVCGFVAFTETAATTADIAMRLAQADATIAQITVVNAALTSMLQEAAGGIRQAMEKLTALKQDVERMQAEASYWRESKINNPCGHSGSESRSCPD